MSELSPALGGDLAPPGDFSEMRDNLTAWVSSEIHQAREEGMRAAWGIDAAATIEDLGRRVMRQRNALRDVLEWLNDGAPEGWREDIRSVVAAALAGQPSA